MRVRPLDVVLLRGDRREAKGCGLDSEFPAPVVLLRSTVALLSETELTSDGVLMLDKTLALESVRVLLPPEVEGEDLPDVPRTESRDGVVR